MKAQPFKKWEQFWDWTALWEYIKWDKNHHAKEKMQCKCWRILYVQRWHIRSWKSTKCIYCNWFFLETHWLTKNSFRPRHFNNIIYRCYNIKSKDYKHYWWRWIKCEWENVEDFYNDMKQTLEDFKKDNPNAIPSIERINVNWNYCKENCIWIDNKDQSKNRRNVHYYDINWEKLTLRQICEFWLSKVDYKTAHMRRHRWRDINRIINTPKMKNQCCYVDKKE